MRGTLEQMLSQLKTTGRKEFPLVIKGDVQGSLEAIVGSLDKLGTDEVAARVLHAGVGGINESTSRWRRLQRRRSSASTSRQPAGPRGRRRDGVEIRYYSIIYDVVDDVKKAMSGMLAPTLRETFSAMPPIREVFTISKVGKVAGCLVTEAWSSAAPMSA